MGREEEEMNPEKERAPNNRGANTSTTGRSYPRQSRRASLFEMKRRILERKKAAWRIGKKRARREANNINQEADDVNEK
jgi:hypothetical protein